MRLIWLFVLLCVLSTSCSWVGESTLSDTDSISIPKLFVMENGEQVDNIDTWQIRRKEIIRVLSENIYGYLPPIYAPGKGKIIDKDEKCCSGHAVAEKIMISTETEKGEYLFPISLVMPKNTKDKEGIPVILLLNFRSDIYDMYIPTEEIIDCGFGVAIVNYEDIVPDDDYESTEKKETEWAEGLASCFSRPTDGTGYGKISLWAWGASRVMDYLISREDVDHSHVAIAGHSRLGKTALWCAANDERFFCAISNDSGCAGAALERNHHNGAETVKDIIRFDSWFCENYFQFAENEENMPFDQHFLLAAIAPRYVAVGSASEDVWADPENELKCCVMASPAWKLYGKQGYVGKIKDVRVGEFFSKGNISYHLRDGIHYLGRQDWRIYMDFMRTHITYKNN